MEDLRKQMIDFIAASQTSLKNRSRYLETEKFSVYVRFSCRKINNQIVDCFDIARVENKDEINNAGYFKSIIKMIEEFNPTPYIFIESVSEDNDRMNSILIRNGFKLVDENAELLFNYYKELN